jgi:hypothetical protein
MEFNNQRNLKSTLENIHHYKWLYPVVAITALFCTAPFLFLDPRFWAEEGSVYYQAAIASNYTFVFTFIAQGNYQFLTNLLVFLSTHVDTKYAPAVTTYLSIALFAVVAMQFNVIARQYKIPPEASILSLVAFSLSPATAEIFASATNIQWIAALSITLMTITEYSEDRQGRRLWIYGWVIACGMTGVPSLLLTPFFFLQAYLNKSRTHFNIGCVLVACVAVQAIVMAGTSHPTRQLIFAPRLLFGPFLLQTVFTQFTGPGFTKTLGAMVVESRAFFLFIATIGVTVVGVLLYFSREKSTRNAAITLGLIWIFVSVLQTLGALGGVPEKLRLLSGAGAARYYATGTLAILVLVSFTAKSRGRMFVAMALVVVLINGASYSQSTQRNRAAHSLSWREQVQLCKFPCTVKIWPEGWTVTLQR